MEQMTFGGDGEERQGSRGEEILEGFRKFHPEHPKIYYWFRKELDYRRGYAEHWGARLAMELVRWDRRAKGGEDVKVNSNYIPLYARLYTLDRDCEGFLEFRKLISADKPATGKGSKVFKSPPPVVEDEEGLMDILRGLL